jgi:hypothetical protein
MTRGSHIYEQEAIVRITIASVFAVLCLGAVPAFAQVEGYVTGGLHRDVNSQQFTGAGGGVLLTAKWISVGAQGDAFFSPPYVAGRFTPFLQGNLFDVRGVRPFVQVGKGYGEFAGTMYGVGVDYRPGLSRVGLRVSVQVYAARLWPEGTRAQPSVSIGVLWR